MPRPRPRFYSASWHTVNILASSPEDAAVQAAQLLRRTSSLPLTVRWKERGHWKECLIVMPFAGPRTAPPRLQLTEQLLQALISNSDFDSESWRIWHDDSGNLYLTYKGRKHSSWREPHVTESWKHYRIVVDRQRVVNATRRGKRRFSFKVEDLPSNLRSWPYREVAQVVAERFPVRGPMTGDSGPVPKANL
jgi:hypothetical protein